MVPQVLGWLTAPGFGDRHVVKLNDSIRKYTKLDVDRKTELERLNQKIKET